MKQKSLKLIKCNNEHDINNVIIGFYVNYVCRQFKNTMSSIIQINSEYVACTPVYRYFYPGASDEDGLWRS